MIGFGFGLVRVVANKADLPVFEGATALFLRFLERTGGFFGNFSRSKCVALSQKINSEYDFSGEKLADSIKDVSFLKQQSFSHYSSENNRCYVELSVTPDDAKIAGAAFLPTLKERYTHFSKVFEDSYRDRHLYDGQTGEELASCQIGLKTVRPSASIMGKSSATPEEASAFIDLLMGDHYGL